MYAFFKGEIADKGLDYAVIEVAGIGYNIKISTGTAAALPAVGNYIKIYTYTSVKEDDLSLYGFLKKDELDIFKLLISVNGIGPKAGQSILSVLSADDLRLAIVSGDAKMIAKAPGIGAKTAQRVILDLKDKVSLEDTFHTRDTAAPASDALFSSAASEAIEALTALGYASSEAVKAVKSVADADKMDVEELLKAALKNMFSL